MAPASGTTTGAGAGEIAARVAAGERPAARLLIGGEWLEADRGRSFDVLSPASGEPVGSAADAGRAETSRAIEAAASAQPAWAALGAAERGDVLTQGARLLEERHEELARLIALEGGKPLAEARGEVGYAAGFLRFYAAEGERALAEESHPQSEGKRVASARRPVGVAGLITIWNFPAAGVTRPAGAALAAGCTAVIKPPEQTPLSAAAVLEALRDAGLPAGAANMVTAADPQPVGRELLDSEAIRKLSFTGSEAVGTGLLRDSAAQLKRVTLELGGQAPFIVLADADLDAAVEGAVRSKFRNSGQTCVCANRIYVEEPLYQEYCERLAARVSELRAGDPLDEHTEVGPLIDAAALAKVEGHVADALERGGRLLCGGRALSGPGAEAGLLYEPTLIADVPAEALVMREETFGPVAPIAPVAHVEEAVAAANSLPWGLAAYLYAGDPERGRRIATELEFGVIGINDPLPAAPHLPFGGLKRSGLGKEGGRMGIEEFLETQLVSVAAG
jgi:succinate-semialdehyde dehydrogenase/glutarate-semialdehyde dehydrogenase